MEGYQKVTLFNASPNGAACISDIAAAMVAIYSEAIEAQPQIAAWGKNASDQWAAILNTLRQQTDTDIWHCTKGSLVVSHPEDEGDLNHFYQKLRHHFPHSPEIQWLDSMQLSQVEPMVAERFQRAILLPNESCLDNRSLLAALITAIKKLGGIWRTNTPIRSVLAGTLIGDARPHQFDLAVDCRGFGAREQEAELRGVRGEIIRVHAPEVNISRPLRLMHPRFQLYIAPHPHAVYAVGATEIESDDSGAITVRSCLELLSALYTIHPAFAEARVIETASGCRPAYPDNVPRIRQEDGKISVNGLYRHGYLLAPTLVDKILKCVRQQ